MPMLDSMVAAPNTAPMMRWSKYSRARAAKSSPATMRAVADNLRIRAERLAGARLSGATGVGGYDPGLVAQGRRYLEIAPAAALWSLEHAVAAWTESVTAALAAGTVLQHATRGTQRAEDIARNNAHDGQHHLWDVDRILRHADSA